MPVTIVGNNTPTAGGVVYGDGTNYASTAAGTAGQVLQSNGAGAPTWATISTTPSLVRSARTSNTILGTADRGTLIAITSGTFSQTFTAAATLGDGWWCYIQNSGTGTITLDPNGSETIDGLTTLTLNPNDVRIVQCTGTAFNTLILSATFYQEFNASGTWTKPPGVSFVYVEAIGGGGSGSAPASGSHGGGGGAFASRHLRAVDVGATVTVTVGTGGTSVTGAVGNNGGDTTFGSLLTARGGRGGGASAGGEGGAGDYTGGTSPYKGAGGYGSGQGGTSTGTGTGADGGYSVMGGGGGGGAGTTGGLGGTSSQGGSGGQGGSGTSGASNGSAGSAPGGGGGGAGGSGASSGAGGNGRVRVWAW